MAEFVQQEIERTIQDLEELEKYGVFERDEVKAVVKKRRDFEYRIRKVNKTKDDFLRYIAYEENLLKLIRMRKERIGLSSDKNLIEKPIVDHVRKLFEFGLTKFQSDISFWLSYLDFCIAQRKITHISNVYFKMLQYHNKDYLWIKFAKFEFETRNSTETARKIFLKAITFHPESKNLWLEYFRFEMLYCTKIRRRFKILAGTEDEESEAKKTKDAIWNGELAMIVFDHALKNHQEFKFAVAFLNMCTKFDVDLTIVVRAKIIEEIKNIFGETDDYWNVLALDEMAKYEQQIRCDSSILNEQQRILKKKAIESAIEIYERACTIHDNQKMWSHYLTFRFSLILDHNMTDEQCVSEVLFTSEKLWSQDKLSVEVFQQWTQLYGSLYSNNAASCKKLSEFAAQASTRWPTNLPLHLFIGCLLTRISKVKRSEVEEYFDECLTEKFVKIREEDVELMIDFWELYVSFLLENRCDARSLQNCIDNLFKICSLAPRRVAVHFKIYILEIFAELVGIQKAREFYEQKKAHSPITKEFFNRMLTIEQNQKPTISNDIVLSIYSDMLHHFGSNEPDIWLDYIRFTILNREPQQVGMIYDKALKSLGSQAVGEFVKRYSLLKNELR